MKEKDIKEIMNLKDGEYYIIPESDYGKAEVWRKNNMYFLFGIPMYGGETWYSGVYRYEKIKELVDEAYSWT